MASVKSRSVAANKMAAAGEAAAGTEKPVESAGAAAVATAELEQQAADQAVRDNFITVSHARKRQLNRIITDKAVVLYLCTSVSLMTRTGIARFKSLLVNIT